VTVLGQYVTAEVQEVQRHDVEPHVEFMVGDVKEKEYTLPGSVSVLGTVDVTQEIPSNESDSGNFHFMVLDNANYQKWSSSSQPDPLFSTDNEGRFNYTFTTPAAGVYHFVFDNSNSPSKKSVVLTVEYDEVLTSRVPDTRIIPVGYVLMVLGALVFVYGLVKKPQVHW